MTPEVATEDDDERTLVEYVLILWKRRYVVGLCAFACGLLGLTFGLLRPRMYESTAVISPPRKISSDLLAKLTSTSPEVMALAGSILGQGGSTKMYIDILGLRQVRENIAEKHDLARVYKVPSKYFAARALGKRSKYKVTRGGLVKIMVTDVDPKRAAALANGYVKELINLLDHLNNVTQAGIERNFLENRLVLAFGDLSVAEEAFLDFKQKNVAIDLRAATEAAIHVYAQLKARLIVQEGRLNVVKALNAPLAPEVQTLDAEIAALRKQLAALDVTRRHETESETEMEQPEPEGAIVPLAEARAITLEYMRLRRDYMIQNKLVEYLNKQLEAVRMREAVTTSVCQVVQRAEPPESPSNSGPRKFALLGVLAGLVLSAVAVIVFENLHRDSGGQKAPGGASFGE